MSTTRKIVEEIIEVRKRRNSEHAMSSLLFRLMPLEEAFENRNSLDNELLKYFPVALFACTEGFFRLAIKGIIDLGEPYLERASKLFEKTKLDFDMIKALHGKQVTIGELIAHNIPLSKLSHINNALSPLLGKDLLTELRTVASRVEYEVMGRPKSPILADADAIYKDVTKTFELRHIICHEMATDYLFKSEEIERCFNATVLFLKASDEFISETLYPNAPLTQGAMNADAAKNFQGMDEKLEEIYQQILSAYKDDMQFIEKLKKSQELWINLRDAQVAMMFPKAEEDFRYYGSVYPMCRASYLAQLTEERIKTLQLWSDGIEEGDVCAGSVKLKSKLGK